MKKPELLAPAGNMEKLRIAVHYGADAVYLGGKNFGLRNLADNFSTAELGGAVKYAHDHGVKVYLTINAFPDNKDLAELEQYLEELGNIPFDAYIAADPGVIEMIREVSPQRNIHLSTQQIPPTGKAPSSGKNRFMQSQSGKGDVTDRNGRGQEKDHLGVGSFRSRRHVYQLLGTMSAFERHERQECKQGGMHPTLPLELRHCRGNQAGRILSHFRGQWRHLHLQFKGSVPSSVPAPNDQRRRGLPENRRKDERDLLRCIRSKNLSPCH